MNSTPDSIHWTHTATPAEMYPLLKTHEKADVIVIGGGLTGCRTALGLADAGLRVIVLEERDIGWGASGRSGGQCNPVWRETPDELRARFGVPAADLLVQTTLTAAHDLFADISRFGIECDPVQNGWVQAAHTRKARSRLKILSAGWKQAGADIDIIEGDDVEAICGSPEYQFALFHHAGGNVQPLSLTRGYASSATARGATIYCGERVQALTRNNGAWTAVTQSGSVSAEQVVIATNAYTNNGLWPGLQQTFFPLVSISLATAPLSEEQKKSVLPNRVTISDTRLAIYYARYDRDDRLIFGCVGSSDHVKTLGGHKRLQDGLHTVFPQLRHIGIERHWAGRIAVTPEMMPRIYEPAAGVTAALGFSGRGIAMTSVMGRALTQKILGGAEHSLPFPVQAINSVPLHRPLKSLIPLAAPAMSLKDKIDRALGGI